MSLSHIFGKPRGYHSFAKDNRWVIGDCMIGLEFEYEGVANRQLPVNTCSGFWTYHEEGSLRDAGAEYVFSQPLFGVDAYSALEWLVNHARTSKWKCTKRTGIHVHLDVRDLEVPQLVGLCILYAALEPILYRWIGDGRENSHFCLPLYKADQSLLAACNILSTSILDHKVGSHNTPEVARHFQRYAGFNLQALEKFCSIEFRHMQTTHNLERIVDWINIIMSLKQAAFKLPTSDGAVVRMMERMGAWGVLNYVFNDRLAGQLFTANSHSDLLELGLPAARDIGIHGCQDNSWQIMEPPKGEHPGFIKWIKSNSKEKKPKKGNPLDMVEGLRPLLEDEDDPVLDGLWADEPPVDAPAPVPRQAARINVEPNWFMAQAVPAGMAPPPAVPAVQARIVEPENQENAGMLAQAEMLQRQQRLRRDAELMRVAQRLRRGNRNPR